MKRIVLIILLTFLIPKLEAQVLRDTIVERVYLTGMVAEGEKAHCSGVSVFANIPLLDTKSPTINRMWMTYYDRVIETLDPWTSEDVSEHCDQFDLEDVSMNYELLYADDDIVCVAYLMTRSACCGSSSSYSSITPMVFDLNAEAEIFFRNYLDANRSEIVAMALKEYDEENASYLLSEMDTNKILNLSLEKETINFYLRVNSRFPFDEIISVPVDSIPNPQDLPEVVRKVYSD